MYHDEIKDYYQKIIPLILSLLPDKKEITLESKRKIIYCLKNIGNTLTNYMSIIIPKLTNYLMSLINNIKFISYDKTSKSLVNNDENNHLAKSNTNYFLNIFSSIFSFNNNNENNERIEKNNNYEIRK